VGPGCVTSSSVYPSNGLIVDNVAGTDYSAAFENFPCQPKIPPVPCITVTEVTSWYAAATQYPVGEEHLEVIDHQGDSPVTHDSALALLLLADQDPAHTWWAYCTNTQNDPACQQPDAEYTSFYSNVLSAGGYAWLGSGGANGSVYHTTWTQGDCFVNAGSATQITVPGLAGQSEYELNGTVDTGGASFTMAANSGMCWSSVASSPAGSR
jgi:hypothetical protein